MAKKKKKKALDLEPLAKTGLPASFSYFQAMQKALSRDTARCVATCNRLKAQYLGKNRAPGAVPSEHYEDLEFWYRMLLRTFCSEVDGLCYVMRQIIIWAEDRGDINLSPAEGTLIREQEYFYNSKRKRIETRDGRFNRSLDNVLLALQLFPRVFDSSFQPDFSQHGYQQFQRVIELRNIVTHPKEPEDLHQLTEIIPAVSEGAAWFYDCMQKLFGSIDPKVIEAALPAQQEAINSNEALIKDLLEERLASVKARTEQLKKSNAEQLAELRAKKGRDD